MSDSEDEFVSASEGEEEPIDKQENVTISTATSVLLTNESTIATSEATNDISLGNEDKLSSRESLQDLHLEHKKSVGSVSDSGLSAASLTSEKKELMEEVIKEVEPVVECLQEETVVAKNEAIEKSVIKQTELVLQSYNSLKEEVEYSLENIKIMEKEADYSLIPAKEAVEKSISVEEAVAENDENSDEETGDWVDWEANNSKQTEVEPPATENNGWDDWSLVDAKKIPLSKENLWEKTEQKDKKQVQSMDNFGQTSSNSTSWGWGGLVSAVGDSFTSTIESSLGFPSAQEMARRVKENESNQEEVPPSLSTEQVSVNNKNAISSTGFGMFSGFVNGGIDVLEAIGKKTFEAVTVVDAKKGARRRMLFTEETGENLSDVLKELKERKQTITMGGIGSEKPSVDVASVFGKSEGMAHLEALEMLSTNTSKPSHKFEREFFAALSNADIESSYTSEFRVSLSSLIKKIGLPYEGKPIFTADNEIDTRLSWLDGKTEDEILTEAVNSFVEYTAAAVQVVAKLANLLLIMGSSCDWKEFVELYSNLARRLNHIGNRYIEILTESSFNEQKVDDISTQILMELSTALDFLKQSHRLLAPMFNV